MKILYIGPYKNELSIGHASRNIISSLCETNDVTIRNIYIQDYNNHVLSNDILKLESKKISDSYDIIIQHATPSLLCSMHSSISNGIKNIAIPILNKAINKKQYEISLSGFDQILIDDEITKSILISHYGITNIESFTYNTNKALTVSNKIDTDIHKNNKKLYFIGSFNQNKNIIKTIISSFYLVFANSSDVSLVLFITENNDQVKNEINKIIEDTKKQLNIVNNNYSHKIVLKVLSEDNIFDIHNTCDTYISLNDSGIESTFNKSIAKRYGNTIIDETNTNMMYDIHQGYGDTYFSGELRLTTTTTALSESMINSLQSQQNHNNEVKTIDKILCQ